MSFVVSFLVLGVYPYDQICCLKPSFYNFFLLSACLFDGFCSCHWDDLSLLSI